MKYLKVTWIRIVISLFSAGIINEIIHISTGDPNRPDNYSFIKITFAFIAVYLMLTNLVKKDMGGKKLK